MRILYLIVLILFLLGQSTFASSVNIDFFKRFSDIFLENYIELALRNNHDLKSTNHKVEQYRNEIKKQFAVELPKLTASSNYLGSHFPKGDNNFLMERNSYILPLSAGYEPDLLLKNRDKTKSAQKLYKAMLANQKGTYISLLSDVASTYINILLFDYLLERQIEILKDKKISFDLNKEKYKKGVIDIVELNEKKQKLENENSIYENLLKSQRTALYNFALLIGECPENFSDIKRGKLENFEYSQTIPEIINSDVIYMRPDIVEIENKLKSAKIDVTVAKKEFFPRFNITGYLVFDTAGSGNFFSWQSSFAFLLAGLSQDIFSGGEKLANLKIKKAKYYELVEKYKQADLNAIKEINNALNIIKRDSETEKNMISALNLQKKNFFASCEKFKNGTISKINLLEDKTSLEQKQALQASSKATRLIDYITLYKAVGGEL